MHPKADSPAEPAQPAAAGVSGKWVIIGILTVALAAAGGSWWFRYNATHKAAKYWGPETAALIRDAPVVTFSTFSTPLTMRPTKSLNERNFTDEPQVLRDVSSARGLVHLRNALLEDRNFNWTREGLWPKDKWKHALIFSDATGHSACLLFSPDSQLVTRIDGNSELSYEPISAGIAEMLAEFSTLPASDPHAPAR